MKEEIRRLLSISPGLKARDIARSLEMDRKEVSRFLHGSLDAFRQDNDHRWHILNPEEAVVEFEAGWVDSQLFEGYLAEYSDLHAGGYAAVRFVIPKDCKLLIVAIAKLLALINQLISQGIAVSIDMSNCGNTRTFFNRAGFFDNLAEAVKVLPARPKKSTAEIYKGNSSSLVEFGAVDPRGENKSLVVRLGSSFVRIAGERYHNAAFTMFSELVGNISEHSQSPCEGFAALQRYAPPRKPKHIQTIVSDSGLGVSATLRPALEEQHPKLYERFGEETIESDIGLVKEAFSKGSISRFGAGRGLGFKSSREHASKFNADLSIRQETFNITFAYRNGQLKKAPQVDRGLSRIMGTHICFDFMID